MSIEKMYCKIRIKQNPGFPCKEYNSVFKHCHQNIRAYPRSKKRSAMTNDWENIAYLEEPEQSVVLVNKFGLSQTQLGSLRGVATPGKF